MNFIAKVLGAICLSTGLISGAVSAQESNITAQTPDSLSAFLDSEEITYEQSVDDYGDPKFDVEYYGIEFSVFYYGCRNNIDCDSLLFFSGYDVNGSIRLSKINSWNKDNRNARAYISDNGSVWVEYDVFLGQHGMHPDDFAKVIGGWTGVQKEFETYIEW